MTSIWDTLGIAADSNERDIKRAYAKRLKQTRPEEDPEGFQALRHAYEQALEYAVHVRRREANAAKAEDAAAAAPASVVDTVSETRIETVNVAEPALPDPPRQPPAPARPQGSSQPRGGPAASAAPEAPTASRPQDGNTAGNQATPSIRADTIPKVVAHLWEKFMMRTDTMTRRKVEVFMHGNGAFQNLSVREAFEFHACCYCAGEDALPQVRNALVEAFNWEQEIRHLQQFDQTIPLQAIGRFSADKVWNAIYYNESLQNPALKSMLENRQSPLRDAIMLTDLGHVRHLQKWIYAIRWHYPEILQYKVKPEILEYWEEKAGRKRYFKESVVTSVVFGAPLSVVWMAILKFISFYPGIAEPDMSGWINLWLGEITSFIGVALISFAPPDWRKKAGNLFLPLMPTWRTIGHVLKTIERWWQAVYQTYLLTLFTRHRMKKTVHWQAIANFGLASSTLYFQWHGAGQTIQTVLLVQALLGLFFIASADLPAVKWLLAPAFGFIAAAFFLANTPEHRFVLNCLFFTGYFLLFMRGHLATLREYGADKLEKLRCLWLAIALPLLTGAKFALPAILVPALPPDSLTHLMSHPLMLCLMWLLCLTGWQVCDYYMTKKGLPQVLFMTFVVPAFLVVLLLDLPPVAMFLHMNLGIISVLIVSNLIFARLTRF